MFKNFKNPAYRKVFLISFLWNGGLFAIVMALFDYNDNKPFSIAQFLFNFLFQGIFMGFILVGNYKKKAKIDK